MKKLDKSFILNPILQSIFRIINQEIFMKWLPISLILNALQWQLLCLTMLIKTLLQIQVYLLLVLLFPDSFTPASIKTLMPHIPDLDEDVILNYLNQMAQPSYSPLHIFLFLILISYLDVDMCLNQRIKETLN
jgi:hypothetical protein